MCWGYNSIARVLRGIMQCASRRNTAAHRDQRDAYDEIELQRPLAASKTHTQQNES